MGHLDPVSPEVLLAPPSRNEAHVLMKHMDRTTKATRMAPFHSADYLSASMQMHLSTDHDPSLVISLACKLRLENQPTVCGELRFNLLNISKPVVYRRVTGFSHIDQEEIYPSISRQSLRQGISDHYTYEVMLVFQGRAIAADRNAFWTIDHKVIDMFGPLLSRIDCCVKGQCNLRVLATGKDLPHEIDIFNGAVHRASAARFGFAD